MEKPTIGIKIADGSYFPILEEGNTKRKRLVLTTVNDNQESVQIDLYKGEGSELLDAAYVGSLLIENITQGPKESSEIELKIGFDEDGTLNAEAGDLATGQIESLSVSMESLGESAMYDIPEFSLDDESEDLDIDDLDFGLDNEELSFDDESEDLDLDSEELSLDDEDLIFDENEETEVPELAEGDFGDSVPELVEGEEDTMATEDLMPDIEEGDFDDIPEEDPFDSVPDYSVPELVEGDSTEDWDNEADDSFQVDSLDEFLEEQTDKVEESAVPEDLEPDDLAPDFGEGDIEEDDFTQRVLPESEMIGSSDNRRGNPFFIALLVIIAIAAIAGISYLIFRSLQGEDAPDLEAKSGTTEEPVAEAQAETPVAPVPEVQQEVQTVAADDTALPVENTEEEPGSDETTTVPVLAAQESSRTLDTTGVWYRIRWGDTLWGISYSFYDTPRDYNQIVKENSIKNPDLIFAETEIFIPSK